jgi:hypothetical protein
MPVIAMSFPFVYGKWVRASQNIFPNCGLRKMQWVYANWIVAHMVYCKAICNFSNKHFVNAPVGPYCISAKLVSSVALILELGATPNPATSIGLRHHKML